MKKSAAKKNSVEQTVFLSVSDSDVLQPLLGYSTTFFLFCKRILKQFKQLFGFDIGFRLPHSFASLDPEQWECLILLLKLKNMGWIQGWRRLSNSEYPDEPKLLRYLVYNKKIPQKGVRGHNGFGYSFLSHTKDKNALWSATGELIERYSLVHFKPHVAMCCTASFAELKPEALDIFSFAGISPETRKKKRARYQLAFDESNIFQWVRGYSLTQEKHIWIPLQLIKIRREDEGWLTHEPTLRPLVSTGAAVHKTRDKALVSGIFELIERDAFMITWLNTLSPACIEQKSVNDDALQNIFNDFSRYNLDLHLLYLPSDFPAHTVLALIIDHSGVGPAVSIGAKTHFDLNRSIYGAVKESMATRLMGRGFYEKALKEKRDLSFSNPAVLGATERGLYWSQPKKIKDILFLTKGVTVECPQLPVYENPKDDGDKLKLLVQNFKEKEYELTYAELLDKKLKKKLGFYSVMVISPELQPMHLDESLPFTWGKRLSSVPQACGFTPNKNINRDYHPFP